MDYMGKCTRGKFDYAFKYNMDENGQCEVNGVQFTVDENGQCEVDGVKYDVDTERRVLYFATVKDAQAFAQKPVPVEKRFDLPWNLQTANFAQNKSWQTLYGLEDEDEDTLRLYDIVKEVKRRITRFKREIYEIGRVLTEAKEILGHGRFIQWYRANFDFSYPTANNFMNVYKHCMGYPELVQTIKPSVLYKIASPNFPADLREFLFENSQRLDDISNERINWICTAFKEGRLDLKSREVTDLIKYKENGDAFCRYKRELSQCFDALEEFYIKVVDLALEMPPWPFSKDNPDDRILGLSAGHVKKLKYMYEDICVAVGSVMPKHFAEVDKVEPKICEEWVDPNNLKRDRIAERHIKSEPYWGEKINMRELKYLRQRVEYRRGKKRKLETKSLYDPPPPVPVKYGRGKGARIINR